MSEILDDNGVSWDDIRESDDSETRRHLQSIHRLVLIFFSHLLVYWNQPVSKLLRDLLFRIGVPLGTFDPLRESLLGEILSS